MALEPRPSQFPFTVAMTYFARGLGAARSGNAAAADKEVEELGRLRDAMKTAKSEYWATEIEVSRLAAAAWAAHAQGKSDEALGLMRRAADIEDKNEKHIVTPARLLPARELLGEMLLEQKRPAEALKEFETSQLREPERYRGYYGAATAAAQSGDKAKAKQYFTALVKLAGQGTRGRRWRRRARSSRRIREARGIISWGAPNGPPMPPPGWLGTPRRSRGAPRYSDRLLERAEEPPARARAAARLSLLGRHALEPVGEARMSGQIDGSVLVLHARGVLAEVVVALPVCAGRMGRARSRRRSSDTRWRGRSDARAQKVHSNEQMRASIESGAAPGCSLAGRPDFEHLRSPGHRSSHDHHR